MWGIGLKGASNMKTVKMSNTEYGILSRNFSMVNDSMPMDNLKLGK